MPDKRKADGVAHLFTLRKNICHFPEMDKGNSMNNKAHCDPGWNDPPLYSYDSLSAPGLANPNKKVNILNKRVAYPIEQQKNFIGGMNPTLPPSVTTAPPPPSCFPIPSDPDLKPSNTKSHDELLLGKDECLNRVQETFKQILEDHRAEKQHDSDEINRRLTIMYKMWEDDRFSSSIHQRILELVEALKAKDLDRAHHLHVGLAVDHPSLCATWIPGVRRIVQLLKSLKQLETQSDQCVSEPFHLISSTDLEEVSGKEEAKV